MNLLKLRETNEVPPDGYVFVDQNDGYRVGPINSKEDWFSAIRKHKQDNGYPLDADWREQAEDQMARLLPPGWGMYADGSLPDYTVDLRVHGEDILRGTRVLAELVARAAAHQILGLDSPIVSQEVAEARALACSRCPYNIPIEGCFSCTGIANVIESVASGIKTPSDPQLRSCAICKCSNKAQTRVRAEVLREGVTGPQMALFRTVPWCWKAPAIDELP